MRESLIYIHLFVLVKACIIPCYGDCKAYPCLQKVPKYMKDLAGLVSHKFQSCGVANSVD